MRAPTLRLGACVAFAVGLLASLACRPGGGTVAAPENPRAVLGAAISLAEPLEAAIARYRTEHPGHAPALHLSGSTRLAQQLRHGAPIGWIISAGSKELDALESEQQLVGASRAPLARNELCWVSREKVESPIDWSRVERFAAGNPRTCPLGRYSEQALRSIAVWPELEPRMLLGENARQTLEYVLRGEATLGVVYCSEGTRYKDHALSFAPINGATHEVIVYQTAQAKSTRSAELDHFVHWLQELDGTFWESHGLSAP